MSLGLIIATAAIIVVEAGTLLDMGADLTTFSMTAETVGFWLSSSRSRSRWPSSLCTPG